MKKIFMFVFISILITACSNGIYGNNNNNSQAMDNQENTVVENDYPKELSDEETICFIDKYVGFWTAFELPDVEEVTPGNYEYDWNPQEFNIYRSDEGAIKIVYNITPSLSGNWYDVKGVVQEDDTTYRINVQSYDLSYESSESNEQYTFENAWPDIDYFLIVVNSEEPERIQVKTRFKENEGVFFYSVTEQTPDYDEWLRSKGYFVDDFNDPLENRIWPGGYGNAQVNLYEAKQIIEDYGLVFDTDIPESEWNNPREYHFDYVVEGQKYYFSWFKCKLGTTVFFSYYDYQ